MPAPTPTSGITSFVQNINGGISGITIAYGTKTIATVSFSAPTFPAGYALSSVEVHWFVGTSTSENNSGALTAVGGTYSYAITQPLNTTIQVQVVFYVTPTPGVLAMTFANSSNLVQSNGVGTSINETNMCVYSSPTTSVTVNVVMSGGGGMN